MKRVFKKEKKKKKNKSFKDKNVFQKRNNNFEDFNPRDYRYRELEDNIKKENEDKGICPLFDLKKK